MPQEHPPEKPRQEKSEQIEQVEEALPAFPGAETQRGRGELLRWESFIGPLPPPDIIAQYEKILPGSADRILRMAEQEMEHRHKVEYHTLSIDEYTVKSGTRVVVLGQVFAFLITIVVVSLGAYLSSLGQEISGIATVIGALATLVGLFIYGHRQRKKADEGEGSD